MKKAIIFGIITSIIFYFLCIPLTSFVSYIFHNYTYDSGLFLVYPSIAILAGIIVTCTIIINNEIKKNNDKNNN